MGQAGAVAEGEFALPPRKPTILARYSRKSKLTTATMLLVGLASLVFLVVRVEKISNNEVASLESHAPKVFSKDHLDNQPSSSTHTAMSGAAIIGASVNTGSALNQQDDKSIPMAMAPDPELTETSAQGDLPRISESGRQPWEVYARPFNGADTRPRLAILVTDLGLARSVTDTAVSHLPANVTLAFDVQGSAIAAWSGRARQEGHEIMLSVPMEPFDYPRSDPGAHTLLTTSPNSANLEKLNWSLRQASGYVGITTMTGSRFTTNSDKLRFIMQSLHDRGLMVLDTHTAPHGVVTEIAHDVQVPVANVNVRIDEDLSPAAIDAAFLQLEQAARLNGHAVGVVPPVPVVLNHLQSWLKDLPQHGIALAPVSALVQ